MKRQKRYSSVFSGFSINKERLPIRTGNKCPAKIPDDIRQTRFRNRYDRKSLTCFVMNSRDPVGSMLKRYRLRQRRGSEQAPGGIRNGKIADRSLSGVTFCLTLTNYFPAISANGIFSRPDCVFSAGKTNRIPFSDSLPNHTHNVKNDHLKQSDKGDSIGQSRLLQF